MSDVVLVTGVSGFLGGHIALELIRRGYTVLGSVRDLKRADQVRTTLARHGADVGKLDFVTLDLTSDKGWKEAMERVRFVQHVASPFAISMPKDPQELIGPAVGGVERALKAAFAGDVERVVMTSSMAAVMQGHGGRTRPYSDEDWTNLDSRRVNAYSRSKTLAERRAWKIAEEYGRTGDLVSINPSAIYGPLLDDDPGTSALLLMRLLRGEMPGVPPFNLPAVDVRDIAALQVAAMTAPEAGGKRLPVSSQSITLLQMARVLADALPEYKKSLPRFQLPGWFTRCYALFDKDVRDNLGELVSERKIDSSRARELLGAEFIPAREAVAAMGQSIVAQKLV
ncbi:NAD-dependent epimerase/dehydratase family protein [Chelativorans sp. YIM 93263]|uniref:NAD-dependent epimerase/dehydratase family protein n=1 Tax=Chelativorans sp. YIM 93263 TaxID=2906648 RepID=UPI0023793D3B|nr:NAD-dependent epimerase/dehydratase family protein [Chelativorans sp. YIM 93263]